MFYPMRNAMALSELLIGLLPITAPIQWITHNPLLAYNAAFFLSFPLSALAAYALAVELTGRHDAAFLAGLAFAFGPYRMNQLAHLQMLAYFWAPIALLGLHRYVRTGRPLWLVVFAGGWLLQALSNGYALFHLAIVQLLWLLWFVRWRKDVVIAVAVAWTSAALLILPILMKYREVQSRLHLTRDINEIKRFSADITAFLSAPPELLIWGNHLLTSRPETALFPGLTVLFVICVAAVLTWSGSNRSPTTAPGPRVRRALPTGRALMTTVVLACTAVALSVPIHGPWAVGPLTVDTFYKPFSIAVMAAILYVVRGPRFVLLWRRRSVLAFYALAAGVLYVFSLGPDPTFRGVQVLYRAPYAWLMELPGLDALRVPVRFAMLATLMLAIVIAVTFARWVPARGRIRAFALVLLSFGLVADGWIRLAVVPAPALWPSEIQSVGPGVATAPGGVVLELPLGDASLDAAALYRAMSHRRPVINGTSGYVPPHYLPFVDAIRTGDMSAVDELARYGPVEIIVDRSRPEHADLEAALSLSRSTIRGPADERWAVFGEASQPLTTLRIGPALPIRSVRANRHEEDVMRLIDHDLQTAGVQALDKMDKKSSSWTSVRLVPLASWS